MATLDMENPLLSSPQGPASKTIQDIQECMRQITEEWQDSGMPINDDSPILHRFCAKLEYLLQKDMKAKSSILGGKKDYWNYISESLGSNKSLTDGIRFVKSLNEVKTNLGRGRALIRFCLMHQRLADTLQQCICNSKVTSDWFQAQSMWLNAKVTADLINNLYDLNDVQFDLSPQGYDLDASWPTFARRTYSSGAQSWKPPSRSTSVSSLASTTLDSSMPYLPSTDEQDELLMRLTQADDDRRHLAVKLEGLDGDRKGCWQRITELELQLSESQRSCSKHETQCKKLETEMKTQQESYEENEVALKGWLEEATSAVSELSVELQKQKQAPPQAPPQAAPQAPAEAASNEQIEQITKELDRVRLELTTKKKKVPTATLR